MVLGGESLCSEMEAYGLGRGEFMPLRWKSMVLGGESLCL